MVRTVKGVELEVLPTQKVVKYEVIVSMVGLKVRKALMKVLGHI